MIIFLWIGVALTLSALLVKALHQRAGEPSEESHRMFVPNDLTNRDVKLECCNVEAALQEGAGLRYPEGIQDVFELLLARCMPIRVDPDKATFLASPTEFFETLKQYIREAQRTIIITALYVGAGKLSLEFVNTLLERLRSNSEVEVLLVLDRNRMEHSTNLSTVSALVKEFPTRVKLYLFQESSFVSQFVPYSRAREILGVQHTKIFAFDERRIILTGANLSDDYFTTRIDRYLALESRGVATWYAELGRTLAGLSHPVHLKPPSASRNQGTPTTSKPRVFFHRRSGLYVYPNECGADPSRDRHLFRQLAHQSLTSFVRRILTHPDLRLPPTGAVGDTYLFPTLQFAKAGILHDSDVVETLLRQTSNQGRIWLSSPYMNIYHTFLDAILKSKAHFHLITASIKTNGWKGQKGFAGYIPYYYLQLERTFFYLMQSFGVGNRVWIHEFAREGTTFHSKGLWVSPRRQSASSSPSPRLSPSRPMSGAPFPGGAPTGSPAEPPEVDPPFLTAIGSTNYGYRSVDKDVESEAFLITLNPSLRQRMQTDLVNLFASGTLIDESRFIGTDGRFQPVVSMIAQLGQAYM